MKLLVIGASGLIGSHILKAARAHGHTAIGTCRTVMVPGLIPLDCRRMDDVRHLLLEHKPDVVIHAAGWSHVDGCEDDPSRAMAENMIQPAMLAKACQERGAKMVYLSSAYVFRGKAACYSEDDQPRPVNIYGLSKWVGEQMVCHECPSAIIVRCVGVYGIEARRKNFAYQVLAAMREGRSFRVAGDQFGNPTPAQDIARWLVESLDLSGTVHLAASPSVSRADWAQQIVTAAIKHSVEPHPNFWINALPTVELNQRAPRPLNAGLVSARLKLTGTPLDNVIAEILNELIG